MYWNIAVPVGLFEAVLGIVGGIVIKKHKFLSSENFGDAALLGIAGAIGVSVETHLNMKSKLPGSNNKLLNNGAGVFTNSLIYTAGRKVISKEDKYIENIAYSAVLFEVSDFAKPMLTNTYNRYIGGGKKNIRPGERGNIPGVVGYRGALPNNNKNGYNQKNVYQNEAYTNYNNGIPAGGGANTVISVSLNPLNAPPQNSCGYLTMDQYYEKKGLCC
jgi:hypothetical protein